MDVAVQQILGAVHPAEPALCAGRTAPASPSPRPRESLLRPLLPRVRTRRVPRVRGIKQRLPSVTYFMQHNDLRVHPRCRTRWAFFSLRDREFSTMKWGCSILCF